MAPGAAAVTAQAAAIEPVRTMSAVATWATRGHRAVSPAAAATITAAAPARVPVGDIRAWAHAATAAVCHAAADFVEEAAEDAASREVKK